MSGAEGDGIFSISIKPRHDGLSDQYNRIFMMKLMVLCSLITAIDWYTDSIFCLIPGPHTNTAGAIRSIRKDDPNNIFSFGGLINRNSWKNLYKRYTIKTVEERRWHRKKEFLNNLLGDEDDDDDDDDDDDEDGYNFVESSCWIQGLYVYKELKDYTGKVASFGIPNDFEIDGIMPNGDLCTVHKRLEDKPSPNCRALKKTFFIQYQYMPFLLAIFSILYYIPYKVYIKVNHDLIELERMTIIGTSQLIFEKYFIKKVEEQQRINYTQLLVNILIKVLYVSVNAVVFYGIDDKFNQEYSQYGKKWIDWISLNKGFAYQYIGWKEFPRPGNLLLPPFAFCEIYETVMDRKTQFSNKHKFLCEMSQNVLYQYCLIVLWFAIVIGTMISLVGLIYLILNYIMAIYGLRYREPFGRDLYKTLTVRQIEYIDFLQSKNMRLYGCVIDQIEKYHWTPSASINGKIETSL